VKSEAEMVWHFERTLLERIEMYVKQILENQKTQMEQEKDMAASLADLDAELAKSDTSVAAIKADNDQILAKLSAGPASPDVTAQLTHLQNVNAALTAILSADDAALNPPPPPPPPAAS
jgi:uncharacterized membrane protein YccC